ncbi:hypothetical protein PO909_002877 [Leuciscus waleckii]
MSHDIGERGVPSRPETVPQHIYPVPLPQDALLHLQTLQVGLELQESLKESVNWKLGGRSRRRHRETTRSMYFHYTQHSLVVLSAIVTIHFMDGFHVEITQIMRF